MTRSLFVSVISMLLSTALHAQVEVLPRPEVHICTPETSANAICKTGTGALSILKGAQLSLFKRLMEKLKSNSSEEDISSVLGPEARIQEGPVKLTALGGKPVSVKLTSWEIAEWQESGLMASFANGFLMNVKLGMGDEPMASIYFAKLECEPDCRGKLRTAK